MKKILLNFILLSVYGSAYAQNESKACLDTNPIGFVKECEKRDVIVNECLMSRADATYGQCLEETRELVKMESRLEELATKAYVDCRTTKQCEKAFALTEVYINKNSDMKIQLATKTTIETFSPTKDGMVGVKSVKIPRKGDSSRISLAAECQSGTNLGGTCVLKLTKIYSEFKTFIEQNLK